MRLHVVSLPHTQTTRRFIHCAFTQNVIKFCDMMTAEGHEVILYSGEENEAACVEHVQLVTEEWRHASFGEWDTNSTFLGMSWQPEDPRWAYFNGKAIGAIVDRADERDILCVFAGQAQLPIISALPHMHSIETAIGYNGFIPNLLHVFPSHAWMNYLYGSANIQAVRAFDAVIPHFFDVKDSFREHTWEPPADPYLLFIGRITKVKGPDVAADIALRMGMKLVVAGPGAVCQEDGRVVGEGGSVVLEGDHIEYVGPVDNKRRAELMTGASATMVPSQYVEPFGNVVAESMMCGTPVVATNWGAFTETVEPGITGYRFNTLREGVQATENALLLPRGDVRDRADARFSLEAIGPEYTYFFERAQLLYEDGWYT